MTVFDERWCLSTRIECSGRTGNVLIKLPMQRLDGTQSLLRFPRPNLNSYRAFGGFTENGESQRVASNRKYLPWGFGGRRCRRLLPAPSTPDAAYSALKALTGLTAAARREGR
jgi:hypothetical protein